MPPVREGPGIRLDARAGLTPPQTENVRHVVVATRVVGVGRVGSFGRDLGADIHHVVVHVPVVGVLVGEEVLLLMSAVAFLSGVGEFFGLRSCFWLVPMACFDVDSFETRFSSFSSSDVDVGLGVCGDAPWSWKGPPGAAILAGILIGWARSWGVAPKSGDDDIN